MSSEWIPRKTVGTRGLFTIERDSRGRYYVNVPDGRRESGLTLAELYDLVEAIAALPAEEEEADP